MRPWLRIRIGFAVALVLMVVQLAVPTATQACGCQKCEERHFYGETWSYCRYRNPGYSKCSEDIWGRCWIPSSAAFCDCITVVA